VVDKSVAEPPILSPTVGRRWLAQEIRRLREVAGLTQGDLAKRLRCNPSKITHIENMRNPVNGPDLEVMLSFLDVPAGRVDWYLRVCDLSREKGWWDGNEAIPGWFSLYVGLEWGASRIHSWDMGYVPGLFQTPDYVESILRYNGPDALVRSQVDARLRRQEALHRKTDPLKVHAILDDAVIRRPMGDIKVMRAQLHHLIALSELPNVTIQVMPFGNPDHRGHLGSFKWLGFPEESDPGVVYTENQIGGLFLEKPAELRVFTAGFAELCVQAMDPRDSVMLITKRAKESRWTL
jgi:transcriptional regulator with XRE-family HTH domain